MAKKKVEEPKTITPYSVVYSVVRNKYIAEEILNSLELQSRRIASLVAGNNGIGSICFDIPYGYFNVFRIDLNMLTVEEKLKTNLIAQKILASQYGLKESEIEKSDKLKEEAIKIEKILNEFI